MTSARELWDATPLAGQTFYVVFWRLRLDMARRRTIRKYLSRSERGFTEDRNKAWRTTSLDEAKRRAANVEGGEVAEWKP